MNANAADIGMGARLSWKTYDTMRTTLGLEKDAILGTREDAKIKKTHGYKEDHFESNVDTTSLLLEARSWMPLKPSTGLILVHDRGYLHQTGVRLSMNI